MNSNVEINEYSDIFECQPTSIAVERNFSHLSNMLSWSRNLNDKNILSYFCVVYNSKQMNQIIE